jgi:DNA primase
VRDLEGRLRFVIERAVKQSQYPKYLYPENAAKSDVLFGACMLDRKVVRFWGIVLVEGSLDVIRLRQHGISLVAGILGSKVSDRQAEIIDRLRPAKVFTMFDKDSSGIVATVEARKKLKRIPISVCRYPAGVSDPAEMSRKEAEGSISRAISYTEFARRTRSLLS